MFAVFGIRDLLLKILDYTDRRVTASRLARTCTTGCAVIYRSASRISPVYAVRLIVEAVTHGTRSPLEVRNFIVANELHSAHDVISAVTESNNRELIAATARLWKEPRKVTRLIVARDNLLAFETILGVYKGQMSRAGFDLNVNVAIEYGAAGIFAMMISRYPEHFNAARDALINIVLERMKTHTYRVVNVPIVGKDILRRMSRVVIPREKYDHMLIAIHELAPLSEVCIAAAWGTVIEPRSYRDSPIIGRLPINYGRARAVLGECKDARGRVSDYVKGIIHVSCEGAGVDELIDALVRYDTPTRGLCSLMSSKDPEVVQKLVAAVGQCPRWDWSELITGPNITPEQLVQCINPMARMCNFKMLKYIAGVVPLGATALVTILDSMPSASLQTLVNNFGALFDNSTLRSSRIDDLIYQGYTRAKTDKSRERWDRLRELVLSANDDDVNAHGKRARGF